MKDGLIKDQTVADLLIAGFEANGIDIVFGVPGEETTALLAAIDRSGMTFVLCRHEQSAAFMASVHGRLTGKPALCLATLGPGAANLITGVADANLDHVPLIAVTGQGARARLERESHQAIDLAALFAPVTKSSRCLQVPGEVSQAVAEAARLAVAEKAGAVHLSLPEDLAAMPCAAEPVMAPPPPMMRALPEDLERAVAVLDRAQRPLIVVGAGVIRAGAAHAARDLAERLNAPMLCTFMAKGILPPAHPLNLFTLGQPQDDIADAALDRADLIIAIGFDPVEYPPANVTNDGARPVVEVAATAPEAAPDWPVKAMLVGDLSDNLCALSARLAQCDQLDEGYAAIRDRMRASLDRHFTPADAKAFAPQDICRHVTQALRPDDVLLSGVGLHKLWVARNILPKSPGQVIVPNGLAGMGLALPGAIEAARLTQSGRVFAISGDGDFLMNLQEMETARRTNVAVTLMVWEDGGYGLIDQKQADFGGGPDGYRFGSTDWAALAQAFGWQFRDITRLSDLPDALQERTIGPRLMRVSVDYGLGQGMPGQSG